MALVDYGDRPPPKRVPLPTKEQIDALTDIASLAELEVEVEQRTEKITVDLEMEVGDADWDARARTALSAHRICLKRIRSRLHKLRNAGKPTQAETEDARLSKKVAKAEALATVRTAEVERTKAKAERVQAAALQQQLALISRTSFHMHFFREARAHLPGDVFEAIEIAANAATRAAMTISAPKEPGNV